MDKLQNKKLLGPKWGAYTLSIVGGTINYIEGWHVKFFIDSKRVLMV